MKPDLFQRSVTHLVAMVVCLIMVIPVYLILTNSFKSSVQASSMGIELPTTLYWENFSTVIERGRLGTSFVNSVLYASASTVMATLFAAMTAYVLSRNPTRLNGFLYFFLIMGIALPINFFTLTKIMQITQLINTKVGIIVLYSATQIPFSVFLMYGFIDSVPRELDEAAVIDGCGAIKLFFRIVLPLLTPVLVTAGILNFLGVWNDFLLPLYFLNNSTHWPMTLAVYNFFGQYQQDWNLVSADILLTILPVILIYLAGQRFILSGLSSGAVKG
ncbi:MAG: carbohydrate ABC transporter permease [Anaerolineae bacterium]